MSRLTAGVIASRYKALKGITYGTSGLLAIMLVISLVVGVITYFVTYNIVYSLAIPVTVLLSTLGFNRVVKNTLLREERLLSVRRLDSASIVEAIILTGFLILSVIFKVVLNIPRISVGLITSGVAVSSYVGYATKRSMADSLKASITSSLTSMLMGVSLMMVHTNSLLNSIQFSGIGFSIGVLSMELVRSTIDKLWRVGEVKPFKLFHLFLKSLLEGLNNELEDYLSRLAKKQEIKADIITFKPSSPNAKPLAIVVTNVHLGPFRNVGSSTLSSLIQNLLDERGVNAIVLKGFTSHENNIVMRKQVIAFAEKIRNEIITMLEEGSPNHGGVVYPPFRTSYDNLSTLIWKVDGKSLHIITLHPNPMEDIPEEALPKEAEDIIAVDSHNSYHDGFSAIDGETMEKIRRHLSEKQTVEGMKYVDSVRIGFSRIVPAYVGIAEGMGVGGISCIAIEIAGKKYAIISADANNALPWVREEVLKIAKEYGLEDAELCTTDTHVVNGISLGGRGYKPLGEAIEPEVLRSMVERIIGESLSNMNTYNTIKYSKVVDEVFVFSKMLDGIAKPVEKGVKLFLAGILASFLASLLIIFSALIL